MSLDISNSYFQIPVKPECVPLLTFILPMGKFAMTRCGQGHKDAGDQLNVRTRELLAGVDRSSKIIDDLLLMPQSLTDAYRDGALVLQSAIRKNFKFSAEKFVVSPQVTFSGLFLSSSPSGAVAIS